MDITCINIKEKSSFADYMIIATCTSARHVRAVADDLVVKLKKKGFHCQRPEGKLKCDWTLIDAGEVVVHLFRKEIRLHYNLEKLWDISFDSLRNKIV